MNITRPALLATLALCGCGGGDGDAARGVVGELASDRIELIAETNEPILEYLVSEGESVSAGDVILRQDATRATARLAEAEAVAGEARARLDELVRGPRKEHILQARANLDGAERDADFRRVEFERARDVHEKGLASPELLDRTQAALDAAEANLELRRAQLQEQLAGTTIEELAQAEQALRQAEARRDLLRVDVERLELRAPVDGLFDSRLFEPGERPPAGSPVAVMLAGTQPYARVYVPEELRVRVIPGLDTRILVDGLESPLPGRVRWIASEAAFTPYFALTEHDRGRLSYLAKIDIVEERERLPDGVPVVVELANPEP